MKRELIEKLKDVSLSEEERNKTIDAIFLECAEIKKANPRQYLYILSEAIETIRQVRMGLSAIVR
ncbi:MAG: hypothetical protein AAB440_03530 [Patescibacteria group bacterium]